MSVRENNFFLKLLAAAITSLLLFIIASGAFPQKTLAIQTQQVENSYTIKLSNTKYFGNLLPIGSNIKHLFLGNQNQEFTNIFKFQSSYSLAQLEAILKGQFTYLEINRQTQAAQVVVDDPAFTSDPQNIDKQWALAKVGFNVAWEKTTGSGTNIVAVVDTGVDATHEDLKSISYVPGFDFVNQQAILPGSNSDDNGHGTLVAGILGATANNGIGIVGTNWQISIMPIKALDSSGKGDADTLAEGIVWAADHGAEFINLSIGGIGFGHDSTLANAVSYAFNKNLVIVAAAGNDTNVTGQDLDQNPVFPICDDNNYNMVIGVAATDQNNLKTDFSNYGRNCIDVDAPGKRILSTINFDPLTKKSSPNSYAYASGTSLAVPFVVGEAALIKSVYPTATNIQIRDRIISTADSIDSLNLSQCGGLSCQGLLGAGEINVPKSLQTAIAQNFSEGDLVKATDLGVIYQISGGQKRLVSPFVFNQLFSTSTVKTALSEQLSGFPEGSYVTPIDGTLVKLDSNPTVYIISNGSKLPVAYQVFQQRGFNFSDVKTLSYSELSSWTTGAFLPPLDGTLLRAYQNKTVYWVINGELHPINYNFYQQRGLQIFPLMLVLDNDISSYPKGDSYTQ